MEIVGDGVDEVLMRLFEAILTEGKANDGHRGDMTETLGVLLRIDNPRARISRSQNRGKFFSALGELLWYLEGSNKLEFIEPYIAKYAKDAVKGKLRGAYGPRIREMRGKINQWENVVKLLRKDSTSKRAVIQLFDAGDIVRRYREVPCTTTMQFLLRDDRLNMSVTMRSNDAYWGTPHDVFCFTMLQELLARQLGCELGQYFHYVGSMHVYEKYIEDVKNYVEEGWQRTIEMPPMPQGDPFQVIPTLLAAEQRIRSGKGAGSEDDFADVYWADICRLLQVFWASKNDNANAADAIEEITQGMHTEVYKGFLDRRRDWLVRREAANEEANEEADVAE